MRYLKRMTKQITVLQCKGRATKKLKVLSKEIGIDAERAETYFRAAWHKEVSHSRKPRWMMETVVCRKSVGCCWGRGNGWMVKKIAV